MMRKLSKDQIAVLIGIIDVLFIFIGFLPSVIRVIIAGIALISFVLLESKYVELAIKKLSIKF